MMTTLVVVAAATLDFLTNDFGCGALAGGPRPSVNRMDGAAWMEAVVLCMLQSISSGRKKMHSSMNNS
jgi:hypothetical protein